MARQILTGCLNPAPNSNPSRRNPDEQPQDRRARPPLPSLEEKTPAGLIRRFFSVQERRAASYNRFHEGFDSHLSGAMGAGDYGRLCGEITREMAALSLEALAVEEALNAASLESPAACIRVVQLGEKAKLRMTCTLQVLKKSHSERRWSWQRTPEEAEEAEAAAAAMAASAHANEAAIREENSSSNAGSTGGLGRLNPGWANGNFRARCDVPEHAAGGFRCGCGERNDAEHAPEPTEEEYDGACAEATRELENAVTGINDALEELRQELADLLEDDE